MNYKNLTEQELGLKIDEELKALSESGIKEITLDDLKTKAPISYDIIFDATEEDEPNGIETTNFSLLESCKMIEVDGEEEEECVFILKAK